jgi:hypothetical protein
MNDHSPAFAALANHLLTPSPGFGDEPDIRARRYGARTLEFAELRRLAGYIAQRRVVAADLDVRDSIDHNHNRAAFTASRSATNYGAPLHILRA